MNHIYIFPYQAINKSHSHAKIQLITKNMSEGDNTKVHVYEMTTPMQNCMEVVL